MPSTWTTLLPKGTTRIRMLPNICQDRWLNIEKGEVPSDKWELQQQAADPASISGSGLIYTKMGGGGNSELFYEDDDAPVNVVRLTRRGGVGYFGQHLYGDAVIMNSSSEFENTQNGFCSAWGLVDSGGALQQSYGIASSTRTAQGEYTVTFTDAFTSGSVYIVIATAFDNSGSHNRVAMVRSQAAGSFRVLTSSTAGSSGSYVDVQWQFAVFGGRD